MSKEVFKMDPISGEYPGYTDGRTWNGWACPYFEYGEAERILNASMDNGYRWIYNRATDTFLVWHSDDDLFTEQPYQYTGLYMFAGGQSRHVYPIGTGSWIWELAA